MALSNIARITSDPAHAGLQAFLTALLGEGRLTDTKVGRARATLIGDPSAKRVNQYACEFRRLRTAGPRYYPSAETVYGYARVFRFLGLQWVWEPVLLYASGHLREFVYIVSTRKPANFLTRSLQLNLQMLPQLVANLDEAARKLWTLTGSQRAAFYSLPEAKRLWNQGRYCDNSDLQIAEALADAPKLSYEPKRAIVLQYVMSWLTQEV